MSSQRNGLRFAALLLVLGLGLPAQTVDLRILQTSDLHAAVARSERDPATGGWLRIATQIRRLRNEAGADHTLVVDCGDTCQGSLIGVLTRGAIGPAMLNAVGYDFWIPGNHEFDFGPRRYVELCDLYKGTLLCGNVRVPADGEFRRWPAWKLVAKGKARIAVIGANASYLHHWYFGKAGQFEVDLAAKELKTVMPEVLRAKPDAIVLAIHQGWLETDHRNVNEIPDLVRLFPELDLILGAHTHRARPGQRLGEKTWYAQPPPHGEGMIQVDMKIDVEEHRVVNIQSHLVEPTADIPKDARIAQAVAPMLETARQAAARQVGSVAEAISADGTPGIDCGTSELLCRVLSEAAKCPVAIHGRLTRNGLKPGPVTESDLFDLVPYENEIYVARLTPHELATVIAEQWQNRKSYVYCGLYGIEATVGEGEAALGDIPQGILGKDGRIAVAFNSYTAAGGGGRFPELAKILAQPASQRHGTGITTRDALRDYLGAHPGLKLAPKEWLTKGM